MQRTVKRAVVIVIFATFTLLCVLYLTRVMLWRRVPCLRGFISPLITLAPLPHWTKGQVLNNFGEPSSSNRYALLLLRQPTNVVTADLLLHLDESNQITTIAYAWKDFVPERTIAFSPSNWNQGDVRAKIEMSADLIQKWNTRSLGFEMYKLQDVRQVLGDVLFVDQWSYSLGNWDDMVVSFDEGGYLNSICVQSE